MSEIKIEKVYSRREEICNIVSHLLGVVLILAGIPCLLNAVSESRFSNNAPAYWVMVIYSVSMLIMFSGSSAYHAAVKPSMRVNLRKVDHSAIYI